MADKVEPPHNAKGLRIGEAQNLNLDRSNGVEGITGSSRVVKYGQYA